MRFMILVRATPASEAGAMPTEELIADQHAFHQAIDESGALIDAMGSIPRRRHGACCSEQMGPVR